MWRLHLTDGLDSHLDLIADEIQHGNVIILPTDTVYGLHCDPLSQLAVQKIRRIKGRDEQKPLLVLAADLEQLAPLGLIVRPGLDQALASIWPAAVTFILPLEAPIAATFGQQSAAVRIPDLPWLRRLIHRTGPLASTSLNRSGEPVLSDPAAFPPLVEVAGMIDAGKFEGLPSTIVDLTQEAPRLIRQGEFSFAQNLWKTLWKSL